MGLQRGMVVFLCCVLSLLLIETTAYRERQLLQPQETALDTENTAVAIQDRGLKTRRPEHKNAYATMMYMGTPRDYEFYVATRVLIRSLKNLHVEADLVVIASLDVPLRWVRTLISDRTFKKKRAVHAHRDMISELPDALLVLILSYLPSLDAVGTCVLSKRWRSLWTNVPKLDYHQLNDRTQLRLSPQFVHRFLLVNKSRLLESMRLVVDSDCEAVDIAIWIGYAVERGLRELELDPNSETGYIRLPSNIYTCTTLEVLKLTSYVHLDVPDSSVCFKSLKILHLQLVYYEDDDSVRRLFSSCSNLEELDVKRYSDNVIKFTIEVPSLKRLSIHDRSDGDGEREYVINAPSLNYLSIEGPNDFEFSLENTPELREARIIDVVDVNTKKILQPLASSVKRLSLSLSLLETMYDASIMFNQLVYLELSTRKNQWWNLLEILLFSSPQLRVLKLRNGGGKECRERVSNSQFYKWINPKFSQPSYVPPCLLYYLKRLEWEGYNGKREEERQVAAYILTNAKHLEKASFSTKSKHFTSGEKLEMLKELAREPKASPSCYFFFD